MGELEREESPLLGVIVGLNMVLLVKQLVNCKPSHVHGELLLQFNCYHVPYCGGSASGPPSGDKTAACLLRWQSLRQEYGP